MPNRAERAYRDDDPSKSREARSEFGPRDENWRPGEGDRPRDRQPPRASEENGEELDDRGPASRRRYDVARRRAPAPLPMNHEMSDAFAMAVERSAALLGDNLRTFQDHTRRFVNRRVARDMEAFEAIARSRSLLEVFSVQQKWLGSLASDYSDEVIRLSRMTGNAVDDTVSAARDLREG